MGAGKQCCLGRGHHEHAPLLPTATVVARSVFCAPVLTMTRLAAASKRQPGVPLPDGMAASFSHTFCGISCERVTRELLQRIGKAAAAHARDARALVRTGVRETFAFVAEHPAKGQLMMIEAMSVRSQLDRLYVKQFGAFVELVLSLTRSFLPPDTATEAELTVMARGVIGAIIHLCQGWIATDSKQPIDELVAGTVRIFAGIGRELGIPDWMDPAHP